MRVLLFVCMMRECDGDSNAGVGPGRCGCEYMGGTRVLSTANDVLEMSVVRGVRGEGGM